MATTKRSPKQIAALKKMQAGARRARAAKKATSKPAAKRKPAAHKTHSKSVALARPAHARPAVAVTKAKPKTSHKAKARAAAGKAMSLGMGLIDDVVIPVAIGGTAASIVDVAYGAARQFLPDSVVDHAVGKPLIKIGAGVAGAIAMQHFGVKPKHAKAFAVGVGIVQVHEAINGLVSSNTKLNLNGNAMTMGELASVLPNELNGLEALGALAAGDASLGAVLPFVTNRAA